MQLSQSALNVYKDCPRCFYFDRVHKQARPRGIFSSLPNGIDGLLKKYFDAQRGMLPPELIRPELEGFVLFKDAVKLNKMRNWKANPFKYEPSAGNIVVGAFDDLLSNEANGTCAILDVKTKGSEPDQAYCEKYYQNQIDLYTLFLEEGGEKHVSFGVLLYFWPVENRNGSIMFKTQSFILQAVPARAKQLVDEAFQCLSHATPPPASSECEYCLFLDKRLKLSSEVPV